VTASEQVVDRVGVPRERILFSGRANETWYSILEEAHLAGKVAAIVEEAAKDAPVWAEELYRAEEAYRAALEKEDEYGEEDQEPEGAEDPAEGYPVGEDPRVLRFVRAHLWLSVTLSVVVVIVLGLVAYWVVSGRDGAEAAEPTVLVMDSKEPDQIYNPEDGGTNVTQIREILSWMPIRPPMEELIHYEWDEYEIIRQSPPDLIIIHASAFYTTTIYGDPAKKLDTFLRAMEETPCKFLVYSRRDDFEYEEEMVQEYVDAHPPLEGRLDALWVPRTDNCIYWRCSATREALARKVRSLLGLP
jgi:hypothetical protein